MNVCLGLPVKIVLVKHINIQNMKLHLVQIQSLFVINHARIFLEIIFMKKTINVKRIHILLVKVIILNFIIIFLKEYINILIQIQNIGKGVLN